MRRAAAALAVVYDEGLAERVRSLLPDAVEKTMFGGVAWMHRGHLVVGVLGDALIARVGPDAERLLEKAGVRPFDFTGRPMKGWVVVAQEVLAEDEDLESWVARCRAFTDGLPAK